MRFPASSRACLTRAPSWRSSAARPFGFFFAAAGLSGARAGAPAGLAARGFRHGLRHVTCSTRDGWHAKAVPVAGTGRPAGGQTCLALAARGLCRACGASSRRPCGPAGPCGARSRGPSRNSLRELRSLRSDKRDESVVDARCARGREPCAPRLRITARRPSAPCRLSHPRGARERPNGAARGRHVAPAARGVTDRGVARPGLAAVACRLERTIGSRFHSLWTPHSLRRGPSFSKIFGCDVARGGRGADSGTSFT